MHLLQRAQQEDENSPASCRGRIKAVMRDPGACCLQCTVRDLYGRQDLGNFTSYFTAPVIAHGAGVLKITPLE